MESIQESFLSKEIRRIFMPWFIKPFEVSSKNVERADKHEHNLKHFEVTNQTDIAEEVVNLYDVDESIQQNLNRCLNGKMTDWDKTCRNNIVELTSWIIDESLLQESLQIRANTFIEQQNSNQILK